MSAFDYVIPEIFDPQERKHLQTLRSYLVYLESLRPAGQERDGGAKAAALRFVFTELGVVAKPRKTWGDVGAPEVYVRRRAPEGT